MERSLKSFVFSILIFATLSVLVAVYLLSKNPFFFRGGPAQASNLEEIQEFNKATDSDKDGLTNTEENLLSTDPFNADSDGDDINDGEEIKHGFDPRGPGKLVKNSLLKFFTDSDSDGLTNTEETLWKTNSNNTDTDSDGYSDFEEIKNGFDPIKAKK